MNYNDLCEEVSALGFESDIELGPALLSSVRRAIRTIYTERPVYRTAQLYKNPTLTSDKINKILHGGGSTDTIPFCAKAYSFITSGIGSYEIRDPSGTRHYDFSGEREIHRGFLYGSGDITFSGDYLYTVYDLALFSDLYGPKISDIPLLSAFAEYNLKEYVSDFLCPASSPTDDRGNRISGSYIRGGIMSIPIDYSGKIFLTYKKAPDAIYGNPDEPITLPDGCEHLAALLTAAYFWLDDDAEKAQYYMSLYKDAMAAVRIHGPTHINQSYQSTNGWA